MFMFSSVQAHGTRFSSYPWALIKGNGYFVCEPRDYVANKGHVGKVFSPFFLFSLQVTVDKMKLVPAKHRSEDVDGILEFYCYSYVVQLCRLRVGAWVCR